MQELPGSVRARFALGLALSATCLWGCPQLRSDDFGDLRTSPDAGGGSSGLDPGNGMGGGAGHGSAGTGSDPANAAGAGGVGGAVASARAPAVLSVVPSNGASGVAADAVVTVTFSEPMNTTAVETAYASSDLPPESVRFIWSVGDTVLQIVPSQPLILAAGGSPSTTMARSYAIEIGSTAVDREGEALPRFSLAFSTLREITETLPAQQDRSLSGNWRSDGVYGDNSCQLDGSTTMCIGDSSNANATYRGFVSFDLSVLPAQIQALTAAQLGMLVDDIRNSPFPDLGALLAEHVSFDGIDAEAFQAAALGAAVPVTSTASVGAALSADVLASVRDDLPARALSQFRLRFGIDTDSDDTGDLVQVLSTTEQLTLTYQLP